MKYYLLIFICFFMIISLLIAQEKDGSEIPDSKKYFGQKPPGIVPEIFAPGIISNGFNERDITFSPDGKEIYFGLITGRHITIMKSEFVNDRWEELEKASFADDDRFYYLEPAFSADGNKIFYLSTFPPDGLEAKPRWGYQNIWCSEKKPDGDWGKPVLDTMINKSNTQFYPSLTKDGTMYFTSNDPESKKSIIVRARLSGGVYQTIERLPKVINKDGTNVYNAFIARDESFLIACIDGLKCEINPGCSNYYISFRDSNDKWSDPLPFGEEINIKGSNAISASVSPDGKYLFFAAQFLSNSVKELSKVKKLTGIKKVLEVPQNGNYDIYWVDSVIIDKMKSKVK